MPSANKQYVIVKRSTIAGQEFLSVFGNRKADPFTSEDNAQRSLTRRKGKRVPKHITWSIEEIS